MAPVMLQSFASAIVAAAALPASHAGRESLELIIRGPQMQARGHLLEDGHSYLLVLRPATASVREEVQPQLPADTRLEIRALPSGGLEILATFAEPLVSERRIIRRDGVTVILGLQTRIDALRARLKERLPRSVPSDYLAPRFREAEADLRAGRLDAARERYRELAQEVALHSWAELRRGDVAVLQGEIGEACNIYSQIIEAMGNRSAAAVAEVHIRALTCPGSAPRTIPWDDLLERIRETDGPVGRYLWAEIRWILADAVTVDDIQAALRLDARRPARGASGVLALTPEERHKLLARALRLSFTPYDVAAAYDRYRDELLRHPERGLLLLTAVRAFQALGLDEQAAAILDRLGERHWRLNSTAAWRDCAGDAQIETLRSAARSSTAGSTMNALPYPGGTRGIADAARDLDARLQAVLEALHRLPANTTSEGRGSL
jgi:hypothetical protein